MNRYRSAPPIEYAYSGAERSRGGTLEGMLWSDPVDDSAQERRTVNALLRRAGVLIAVFAVVLLVVVMWSR